VTRPLNTIEAISEILVTLGYEVNLGKTFIAVKLGSSKNPFTAVLSINENHLNITCQFARLGAIKNKYAFFLACLDANVNPSISPYAFGIITDSEDPANDNDNEWPIVLTNTIPLGAFQASELESAMDSLLRALQSSRTVIAVGVGKLCSKQEGPIREDEMEIHKTDEIHFEGVDNVLLPSALAKREGACSDHSCGCHDTPKSKDKKELATVGSGRLEIRTGPTEKGTRSKGGKK